MNPKEKAREEFEELEEDENGEEEKGGEKVKEKKVPEKAGDNANGTDMPSTKRCPECGTSVPVKAVACPECGYDMVSGRGLGRRKAQQASRASWSGVWLILIGIIVMIPGLLVLFFAILNFPLPSWAEVFLASKWICVVLFVGIGLVFALYGVMKVFGHKDTH